MLHTTIFIGRSGSGKGTQAARFMDKVHNEDDHKRSILYVETGDRFRSFIREQHLTAERAREINDAGERQPDFLACWMWGNVLVEELGPDMHLVFDGAPRALDEARVLSTALEFYKRENPTVIYINTSAEWSEELLMARGRSDDASREKIMKKLGWFDESVLPVIEYYKADPRYKFIEVNGEQPIDKVEKDIVTAFEYRK